MANFNQGIQTCLLRTSISCRMSRTRLQLCLERNGKVRRRIFWRNVSVNIPDSPVVRRCAAKRTGEKRGQPRSPYCRTRRLRFTAVFSDFAYRALRLPVCAGGSRKKGKGQVQDGRRRRRERGGEVAEGDGKRDTVVVLSSAASPELLRADSPFPHRFAYIQQSWSSLRAQFIAKRPPPAGTK